jgi:hypothetical protein
MKKFALILILFCSFLYSCKEECYECTANTGQSNSSITVEVCDGTATVYQNGQFLDVEEIPAGVSNKQYVEDLENGNGYNINYYTSHYYRCSKK